MVLRVNEMVWAVILTSVVILLLTGNFDGWVIILVGMSVQGMILMGMIAVLPFVTSHHQLQQPKTTIKVKTDANELLPPTIIPAT